MWDVVWGGVSPLAAYLLRDGTIYRPGAVAMYCGISLLASLLVFQWFKTSSPLSRFFSIRDAFELLKACVLVAALSAMVVFSFTRLEDAPRSIPVLHCILLIAGLLAERLLSRIHETRREAKVRSASAAAQHVLIIGASRLAWFFSKMVEELAPGEYQIVAILDAQPELTQRSLNGYPIIGVPTDLDKVIADYARHGVRIDKVVVAEQPEELSGTAWNEIVRICTARQIGLEVLPERLMSAQPVSAAMLSPPAAEFEMEPEREVQLLLDRPFWRIKRGIDFAVALGVSILTFPVALAVCVLVLLDVGIPIIFWQQRVGRDGAPLFLYKFRTLKAADDRRTNQPGDVPSPSGIGRFLRATRLDELPQIWNILFGDMSLTGPRPLLPVDQPKDATVRLQVRPGLSGWAQVCGGNLISTEEKTALDEWYIRHASLKLDAVIVLRTIWMLLTHDRRDEKAIAVAMLERPNLEPRPGRDEAPTTDAPASFAEIPYPPDLDRASAGP